MVSRLMIFPSRQKASCLMLVHGKTWRNARGIQIRRDKEKEKKSCSRDAQHADSADFAESAELARKGRAQLMNA